MIKNKFMAIFVGVLLFFVLSTGAAFANRSDHGTMVVGYHMIGTGTGMGWMMFLLWGFVLGILILVIRWVLNLSQRENRFAEMQTSASDILKDRFAKGEIDITEFELKQQIIAD